MSEKFIASFIIFLILAVQPIYAKVLIITHAFNRPDFIEIQCRTFKKFLQDDYEFVVFSDASSEQKHAAIVEMCQKWNTQCIRVPQDIHNRPYTSDELNYSIYSRRHTNAIKYSLDVVGFAHNGNVIVIDSDMFLIRPFSFNKILKKVQIASVFRHPEKDPRIAYLWPGLCCLAMNRLPNKTMLNFNCTKAGEILLDTGGSTYFYLKKYFHSIRVKEIDQIFSSQVFCPDHLGNYDNGVHSHADYTTPVDQQIMQLKSLGFNEKEIEFLLDKPDTINFAFNNHFLHYRAASGWTGADTEEYNRIKTEKIRNFIEAILNE